MTREQIELVESTWTQVAEIKEQAAGLRRLDGLLPTLRDLGRRRAGYGVTEAHYDTVGAALLSTLEQGLGSRFTPDVRTAWANAYGLLAGVMKTAAQGKAA